MRNVRVRILLSAMLLLGGWLPSADVHAQDWVYSTRPGDNLWNLSERYLKTVGWFRRLQEYNAIVDPLHILPGTRIRVPVAWLRVEPAAVEVVEVRGNGTVTRAAGGSGETLAPGLRLTSGDRLQTAADTRVVLQFADGSQMLVRGDSELLFDRLSAWGETGMVDTRVRLTGGRVESQVEPAAGPASRFEIDTPAAVAAVRGTRFRVGADATSTRSEVIEGSVRVTGGGSGRNLEAGFGVVADAGRAPPPPRELLPPPGLEGVPELLHELVLTLEFEPLERAVSYRAELFAADGISAVDEALAGFPRVEFDAPPDGVYQLRVRGIESDGLEGLDAVRTVNIDARPVPPALVQPPDRAATHGEPPELWWSVPEGAADYQLQLATDAGFANLLLDESSLTATKMRPRLELPPGEYWWRVAQRDGSGDQGPFGVARQFRMQAVPEPPAPGEAAIDEASLTIGWGRSANSQHYDFEMARDAEFSEGLVSQQTPEPSITLERPGGGTWWFRARGVSDEGVAGPWSPVNSIEIPSDTPWQLLLLLVPLLLLL